MMPQSSSQPHRVRRTSLQSGMTLLEMLIAVAIMGVIMLAFTQLFGSSLSASSTVSARNEVLSEAQVAQQLIAARLKSASYIYPPGTTFQMTNTVRTRNTVGTPGQQWTVGTDPVVAMLVPPKGSDSSSVTTCIPSNREMCFTFYAYYPIKRGVFIDNVNPMDAPAADLENRDTWLLMEYREYFNNDGVDRSSNRLASPPDPQIVLSSLGGRTAQILAEYVQPNPVLFEIDGQSVAINLQMERNVRGKTLTTPPLNVRVYPRNAMP